MGGRAPPIPNGSIVPPGHVDGEFKLGAMKG